VGATRFEHPEDRDAVIYYLGDYVPWWWLKQMGIRDAFSGQLLDLKQTQGASLTAFTAMLGKEISQTYVGVTAVPSHDPAVGTGTGVRLLAKQVASKIGAADGRDFLRRTVKIPKLAHGGDRSVQTHLNSMVAEQPHRYAGGRVLLIDDIMTSGNSFVAARKLLLDAGAETVICVALGKTKG
jgi:predicted amidophosphoribosyltransferase